MTNQEAPLWRELNSRWQEAVERRKTKAKAVRREREAMLLLSTSGNEQLTKLEEWFGGPIPNASDLSQVGLDVLLECALKNTEPNKDLPENKKSNEDYLIEAVWWLNSYKVTQSLYDLSISTAKWRKAQHPRTAVEISEVEICKSQNYRPYIERVLTSHAAALCDIYRTTRDRSLLRRAVELDTRALSAATNDKYTYLQLHRAYSLLGDVNEAIGAVVKAAGDAGYEGTGGKSVSYEISATWRMIKTEGWGNQYRDAVLQAMDDGSLPEMDDLPF